MNAYFVLCSMHTLYSNIICVYVKLFTRIVGGNVYRDYTRHDPGDLDLDDRGLDVGMH